MAERFIYPPTVGHPARVSVASGGTVATFTDAALANHDWAGAQLWITPDAAAPYRVGTIAEVSPQGQYENLELPLFRPWPGAAISGAKFELVDGLAIAGGATQAGIYARFAAFLLHNMGLVGNNADTIDFALAPNNSLFVDGVTRTLYQWRNGVLNVVSVIGAPFTPKGPYSGSTPYALNDFVTNPAGTGAFISNHASNSGNALPSVGSSNSHWTVYPIQAGPPGAPGSAVVTGSSATSLAIGTEPKIFTLAEATARGWAVGARVRATSTSNPTHWMEGMVTDYAHPSLTISVDTTANSGTHADWSLSLIGQPGAAGAPGVDGASALTRVRVVATANVTIASALENGDTVDGVTLATNDLILLTAQTAASENGVYVVAASGTAARHTSFDTFAELAGSYFSVLQGSSGNNSLWRCTSDRGGTIGTTAVVIEQVNIGKAAARSLTGTSDTIVASDHDKLLIISGTGTIAVAAAASLGNGFKARIRNVGSSPRTIDPNGTELIDGGLTLPLLPGQSGELVCDGAAIYTIGLPQEISTYVTASAQADMVIPIPAGYRSHQIELHHDLPVSAAQLHMTVSVDGGATYFSTGYQWTWTNQDAASTPAPSEAGSANDAKVQFTGTQIASGSNAINGRIFLPNPTAGYNKHGEFFLGYTDSGGKRWWLQGIFLIPTTSQLTHVKLYHPSVNIAAAAATLRSKA
jgi:hypothetical protein